MLRAMVCCLSPGEDWLLTYAGYKTFYTNNTAYRQLVEPSPSSWTLIPALRHALTQFPDRDYLWSLSPHALIMDPTTSLYERVFSNLPTLMLKDIPVVPPDSVIHTFSHLKPSQVALILAQDGSNIATNIWDFGEEPCHKLYQKEPSAKKK